MELLIDFKKKEEKHIEELKSKGFNVKRYNVGVYIYDLKNIYCLVAPTNDLITQLTLVKNKRNKYSIDIRDMEYFEIQAK
jgi:hypothetical protein